MIQTVHIENFKCLQNVRVELGPFTVLIGPNDSGKTSFLDALHLLGRTTERALGGSFRESLNGNYPQALQDLVWQKNKDRYLIWHVLGKANVPFEYRLDLPAAGGQFVESLKLGNEVMFDRLPPGEKVRFKELVATVNSTETLLSQLAYQEEHHYGAPVAFGAVADALASTEEYHLNPQAMRSPAVAAPNPNLTPTGENLAAVLNAFLIGPDRSFVTDLEQKLHDAIPSLKGFSTPVARDGDSAKLRLEFTLAVESKPPITIPASQASDGAILLTAFLALAYGNTPQILLIEEPENGLHPSRLKLVIDILRQISKGEIGNQARQVILTTHSPLLLNLVEPDEVRIFRRDGQRGTQVTPMDKIQNFDRWPKEFGPGELWSLFGEEELVKGPPA
jgi:predicted ATPase